jgi:hypothetical protein
MTVSIVRALVFSCAVFVAACTESGGTRTDTGTNPSESANGTYQLRTVRGTNIPVSLFSQCSLPGSTQPCAACSESAGSGTLTLKSNPASFDISLVANGTCVDPLGRSPTSTSTYTSGTTGSWSISGGTITFSSNQMNLSTGTLSGSTISTSFNWINPDPGGQPLSVSATFTK